MEVARRLEERLARKGVRVFFSEKSIPPGAAWREVIRTEARRCEIVVLIDSPSSRQSEWVQQEAGIALGSGSLLIPVCLDVKPDKLPGWLNGLQAIVVNRDASLDDSLDLVAEHVCNQIGAWWTALPPELREPRSVSSAVLRAVILDQFSEPARRVGAWSRQYDRYRRHYYGDRSEPAGVAQSVSLTFTGMIVERLSAFAAGSKGAVSISVNSALRLAEAFVLSSQDPDEGGFGRHSSHNRTRPERAILELDLRHTCWGIRALLSINRTKFSQQINLALVWLVRNAHKRDETIWTPASLLAVINDPRLLETSNWRSEFAILSQAIQEELAKSFDSRWHSWIKGEEEDKKGWISIDNALYVLYCLKHCERLSTLLEDQRDAAIEHLLRRCWPSRQGVGLPLFHSDRPEVGPTAQLLEFLDARKFRSQSTELSRFVATRLADRRTMPSTFAWHLIAALAVPDLRDQSLPEQED